MKNIFYKNKCINHKNGNPRKNDLNNLVVVDNTSIYSEVSIEEKENRMSMEVERNNTIREDQGKDISK